LGLLQALGRLIYEDKINNFYSTWPGPYAVDWTCTSLGKVPFVVLVKPPAAFCSDYTLHTSVGEVAALRSHGAGRC
jgi:hypothetical protein